MIKAVIFDWDGTLADNLHYHFLAFKEALHGKIDLKPLDLYIREGGRSFDIVSDLLKSKDTDIDDISEIKEVVETSRKIYKKLAGGLKMKPAGRELIMRLKKHGFKIGLVTGSYRKSVCIHLTPDEMELFDHIVTADETKNPKPSPQPYLLCMRALGIEPGESVVIENAPLGIDSAKSAGMLCIAITSTLPEKYLLKADFVVPDLLKAGMVIDKLLE